MNAARTLLLGLTVALAATAAMADGYPRIAMLWSAASGVKGDKLANWARHGLILVGPEDLGLEWTPQKYFAMSETIKPEMIGPARQMLQRIHQLNPSAVVLCEVYFFEENDRGYEPNSPWWLRDRKGRKVQFWPGCHDMDLSKADYVAHVARRIAALHAALGDGGGVFLDNLGFDDAAKAGWLSLLKQARATCGNDMPILVNAGWDSDDLEWVCSWVNGIMYEDSVAHAADKDTEAFYGRIAKFDGLLMQPAISVNEKFGKRGDAAKMERELFRTLVYTNMHFLYSDSTNGHKHSWYPIWDAALGQPVDALLAPAEGQLARRQFAGGVVLWLPEGAKEQTVELDQPLRDAATGKAVKSIHLKPDHGAILLK